MSPVVKPGEFVFEVDGDVQAPRLLVLLLGLAPGDLAPAGVVELAAQGVEGVALVELPGDLAQVALVRQVFGRVDGRRTAPYTFSAAASAFCRVEVESLPTIREAVVCPYY